MSSVNSSVSQPIGKHAFTCISCRVIFADADIQREHYRTDWHKYNLKRKVAELNPVTADQFQQKVRMQSELAEKGAAKEKKGLDGGHYCNVCRKGFNSLKSFDNHLLSNKHKELVAKSEAVEAKLPITAETGNIQTLKPPVIEHVSIDKDDESMIVEVGTTVVEDNEDWSDEEGLGLEECLFCHHVSKDMSDNLQHMSVKHGFFIPDVEYCVDVEGLLLYLGEKIACGFTCIWCNERKTFHNVHAVQQHMRDKGHCKLWHEGESMLEFSDYFDYSASYQQVEASAEASADEVEIPVLPDDTWELVLPSGATIGHRLLMRYYRQNLKPSKQIALAGSGVPRRTSSRDVVLKQYKSLGWTGCRDPAAALRKAKDLQYWKRVQDKYAVKLGSKANKLQRYFRRQNIML